MKPFVKNYCKECGEIILGTIFLALDDFLSPHCWRCMEKANFKLLEERQQKEGLKKKEASIDAAWEKNR